MKSTINPLPFIAFLAVIFNLNSCLEKEDLKTEEEEQLDKLKTTWTMTKATCGGVERTNEFVNTKIIFGGSYAPDGIYNFTTIADNMPTDSPLMANATWKFNISSARLIDFQGGPSLVGYSFLDSYAVNAPDDRELLIELDIMGIDESTKTWQFFFTEVIPD